eukprot:128720-Prymnesium_polylepis.1
MFNALKAHGGDVTHPAVERLLKAVPLHEQLLTLDQLLFIVNVPGSTLTCGHWYFVQADLRAGHIVAVDSCGGKHDNAIAIVQHTLESLHRQAAVRMGGTVPSTAFTADWRKGALAQRTPQQPDA